MSNEIARRKFRNEIYRIVEKAAGHPPTPEDLEKPLSLKRAAELIEFARQISGTTISFPAGKDYSFNDALRIYNEAVEK